MMTKTLVERVEEGKAWLAAHDSDPPARNYIWYRAGIIPGQKHGSHVTAETIADYERWYKAFEMWKRLYAQLEAEHA